MEIIFALIGLAFPVLIITGIVYFILRIKSSGSVTISYRSGLRVYLNIAILVCTALVCIGGLSTLLRVGFGEVVGPEFSYGNVYENHNFETAENPWNSPTFDGSKVGRSLSEKLDLEMRENLINGVSLASIGLILLTTHWVIRSRIERFSERSDSINKLFKIGGLVIFAIVTLISLATGIPETLSYAMLDVDPGDSSPGESISIAVVALPIWIYYLLSTMRILRLTSTPEDIEMRVE